MKGSKGQMERIRKPSNSNKISHLVRKRKIRMKKLNKMIMKTYGIAKEFQTKII